MQHKIPTPRIPDYMRSLPDNVQLAAREVAEIYGVRTDNVSQHVKNGNIPPHTSTLKRRNYPNERRWSLGSIRKAIKQSGRDVGSQVSDSCNASVMPS